jgi:hypothetical protein
VFLGAPHETDDQRYHQECQKNEKHDFGYAGGGARNTAKAQGASYKRYDEKHQRPVQHVKLPRLPDYQTQLLQVSSNIITGRPQKIYDPIEICQLDWANVQ